MSLGSHARHGLVLTTIGPAEGLVDLSRGAKASGWHFVVVGDAKTPEPFVLTHGVFVSLAMQRDSGIELGKLLPQNHYTRKNLGYLWAIADGAEVIVETDDDNWPFERFWQPRQLVLHGRHAQNPGWVNAYSAFTEERVWPRGYPLNAVLAPALKVAPDVTSGTCPVQQGLVNGDPDVDSVFRMTVGGDVQFRDDPPLMLDEGCWCPFNSQNTTWWPAAWPFLYLPATCTFRMTDIWRSLVAQAWLLSQGLHVAFTAPSMRQERNAHDLMSDFAEEIPGFLHNSRIVATLKSLPTGLPGPEFLVHAYERLASLGLVERAEVHFVHAWLRDLGRVMDGGAASSRRGLGRPASGEPRQPAEGDDDRR